MEGWKKILKSTIDVHGINAVCFAITEICNEKANRLRKEKDYQDENPLADDWEKQGKEFGNIKTFVN